MKKLKLVGSMLLPLLIVSVGLIGCGDKEDSNISEETRNAIIKEMVEVKKYVESKQCVHQDEIVKAIESDSIEKLKSLNIDYNCYIKELNLLGLSLMLESKNMIDFFLTQKIEESSALPSILVAGAKQNLSYIKLLENSGASFYSFDIKGKNIAHYAIKSSDTSKILEVLKYLKSKNININKADLEGNTPLHETKDKIIAEYLIKNGADINAKTQHNWTPLHKAANNRKYDIVKILLDQKEIDINVQEKYHNYSALHMAVDWGNIEMVQLLVDNNIDKSLKDDTESTALEIAQKKLEDSSAEQTKKRYTSIISILKN